MKIAVKLTCLFLVLISGLVHAETIPAFEASYDVLHGQTLVGNVTEKYLLIDGQYRYESSLRAVGMAALFSKGDIVQTSIGRLENESPRPAEYRFQQGKNKNYQFLFEAAQIKIVGHKDRSRLTPKPPVQDELSLMIEIRRQLAQGNREGELSAIYGSKARDYRYQYKVIGEEKVETPQGQRDGLLVERTSSQGKYRYLFWCVPELDYLPVKIEREDREGRTATLILKKYQQNNNKDVGKVI